MRIILLNGPPSSGKDTAARALASYLLDAQTEYSVLRMSHPTKRAFAGVVNARIDEWGNVENWEDQKDMPSELLGGKSYRQWQIEFSEKFMKPLYGEDIFGRLFAHSLEQLPEDWNGYILVPDCGFEIEAETLASLLPAAHKLIVRCHRPGYDFKNDCRSYLYPASIPLQLDLYNGSDLKAWEGTVLQCVSSSVWNGYPQREEPRQGDASGHGQYPNETSNGTRRR
jgi:hypothetical protein